MKRLFLYLLVITSALAVVWTRHESRSRFVELEALQREADELEVEWGRLQLEQATWAEGHRIEAKARETLDLTPRDPDEVVVILP
ncbi:MAG: cell division protein FtsL [Pseudomonadota bacterium]